MQQLPESLLELSLTDGVTGQPQPLAGLWAKGPVVLVWVRHFG